MSAFSPRQMFLLDLACKPIEEALGGTYNVGTSVRLGSYRDVDVRTILPDEMYDALVAAVGADGIAFLGLAIGQYLHSLTEMPIDYQIQRQTEANELHKGSRNPVGIRDLGHFRGDAAPESTDGSER